ncbi:hypothetical protein BUALT_Bualt07G0130300 [Buddleja alternifolia]|uniref:Phytocyanin domain-containing protein n=1 Tax=Buddleja alternifolia TaxID=168488 RepID=A0AAV6XH23_9LAMI|nr:hypothetical protein BUALT_Bualt07G0130300 [Buddleja alternifolia]
MDRLSCLTVCGAILAIMLNCASAQNVHVVGDGLGWDIPPNTVSYANWASGRTFVIGDILVFNFMTNQHDVLQVPQASYAACTQDNAIGNLITTGPANITLDSAGDHHYICTVGRHCLAGQRLAITVSSTPGAANPPMTTPPTTPTTPSPTSTQPDACAPTDPSGVGGPTAAMGPAGGPAQLNSASITSLATTLLLSILSLGIALVF